MTIIKTGKKTRRYRPEKTAVGPFIPGDGVTEIQH